MTITMLKFLLVKQQKGSAGEDLVPKKSDQKNAVSVYFTIFKLSISSMEIVGGMMPFFTL